MIGVAQGFTHGMFYVFFYIFRSSIQKNSVTINTVAAIIPVIQTIILLNVYVQKEVEHDKSYVYQ